MRLLLCGTTTRAAAESAASAGFHVTALDAFADLDQHPSVRALAVARDFAARRPAAYGNVTAWGLARAARTIEADAVAYLSPFENHPAAVSRLSANRTLWGNSPETLRRVRNPFVLAEVARRHGFAVPRLVNDSNFSNDSNDPNDRWLVKPFRSGGGSRIRVWRGERISRTSYLQEEIEGTAGSLIFAAASGEAVPLGFSRQIIGDATFGASGYRYCGSILASLDDVQFANGRDLFGYAARFAGLVASEFGVAGLNGIDFIARDGLPFLLEVNPRWSSSVEVAERAFRTTFFPAHADACERGTLPSFDCASQLRQAAAFGKAIVYARSDGFITGSENWLGDPDVRDVPPAGQHFRAGQPICSVFGAASDSASCYRALAGRAARVYAAFEETSNVPVVTATG